MVCNCGVFFISLHNYSAKLVHSSTCSLVLILPRWDVIRMQAHHRVILVLRSPVVTQMWILNTWFVLFWRLFWSLCWLVSDVWRFVEIKPVMLILGAPGCKGAPGQNLFTQSPLCQPKIRASFPHSSFSSEFHTAQIQGCILLGHGNFFLSPGSVWQKQLSNPEH